jgi:chemotaxis protein CheX
MTDQNTVKAQSTHLLQPPAIGGCDMSIALEAGASPARAKVQLEPVLDLGAAERLHAQLSGLRGRPLDIDASQVERLGGLSLQVLLSASNTWQADGQPARLVQASPAFEDAWALFAAPAFPDSSQQPFGQEGLDA